MLTECLLGRGLPWKTEVRPHSRERGLVQGKLCGCYVGLSPGRSNPRAHPLVHLLLLLLKPLTRREADLT